MPESGMQANDDNGVVVVVVMREWWETDQSRGGRESNFSAPPTGSHRWDLNYRPNAKVSDRPQRAEKSKLDWFCGLFESFLFLCPPLLSWMSIQITCLFAWFAAIRLPTSTGDWWVGGTPADRLMLLFERQAELIDVIATQKPSPTKLKPQNPRVLANKPSPLLLVHSTESS